MAESRDQQLLLNILRAGGREPLQFSAIGEITRTGNAGGSLETEATNLIAGGADAISPTLGLELSSSPVVKVTPLSNKEFTEGLLRPTAPETLHLFINQGWDTEFLLPLVVGGGRCPGEGEFVSSDNLDLNRSTGQFGLRRSDPEVVTISVTNEQALEMVRSGVGEGFRVRSLTPGANGTQVELANNLGRSWTADIGLSCPSVTTKFGFDPESTDKGSIQLRSVEGMIYHLGEAVRPCILGRQDNCYLTYGGSRQAPATSDTIISVCDQYLFRVQSREGPAPVTAAVAVRFNGRNFWVDRLDRCEQDRSLKTLNFLSQLIALQTSGSDLAVTPSVINVGR